MSPFANARYVPLRKPVARTYHMPGTLYIVGYHSVKCHRCGTLTDAEYPFVVYREMCREEIQLMRDAARSLATRHNDEQHADFWELPHE